MMLQSAGPDKLAKSCFKPICTYICIYSLVVIGLLYKASPNGYMAYIYIPAEGKALSHEAASALDSD